MRGRVRWAAMDERSLYERVLGLSAPWTVEVVELDEARDRVDVHVVYAGDGTWSCPECGGAGRRHDARRRTWRHLDTCQYRTFVTAEVPRVECPEHGVRQVAVPWSEPGSRFTALFEALALGWLREASISAVARRMRLSWDQVDGILARAVRRGLARRSLSAPRRLAVDEVSAKRGHRYLTIISDHDTGKVLHVSIGRRLCSRTAIARSSAPSGSGCAVKSTCPRRSLRRSSRCAPARSRQPAPGRTRRSPWASGGSAPGR